MHLSQQIAITPTPHLHAPQHPSSPPTLTKPLIFVLQLHLRTKTEERRDPLFFL